MYLFVFKNKKTGRLVKSNRNDISFLRSRNESDDDYEFVCRELAKEAQHKTKEEVLIKMKKFVGVIV